MFGVGCGYMGCVGVREDDFGFVCGVCGFRLVLRFLVGGGVPVELRKVHESVVVGADRGGVCRGLLVRE